MARKVVEEARRQEGELSYGSSSCKATVFLRSVRCFRFSLYRKSKIFTLHKQHTRHKPSRGSTQNVQVFVGSHNAGISGAVGSQPGEERAQRGATPVECATFNVGCPRCLMLWYIVFNKSQPKSCECVLVWVHVRKRLCVCVCVAESCDNAQWRKVHEKNLFTKFSSIKGLMICWTILTSTKISQFL